MKWFITGSKHNGAPEALNCDEPKHFHNDQLKLKEMDNQFVLNWPATKEFA